MLICYLDDTVVISPNDDGEALAKHLAKVFDYTDYCQIDDSDSWVFDNGPIYDFEYHEDMSTVSLTKG